MATATTYEHRFGSFRRALRLIETDLPQGFSVTQRRRRLKLQLQDEFAKTLANAHITSKRSWGLYTSESHRPVVMEVARCFTLDIGQLRWQTRFSRRGGRGTSCIAARLDENNRSIADYVFISRLPDAVQGLRLSEEALRSLGCVTRNLSQAIQLLLRETEQSRPSVGQGDETF